MNKTQFDRGDSGSADDLSPTLRRAVEDVLRKPPPDDVSARALAAARRIGVSHPVAGRALRRRPVAWGLLGVAASAGLAVALVWWYSRGTREEQVVIQPQRTEPGNIQPIPPDPRTNQTDRLPSLWAYRQAAGQSAETLDALLDQDAHRVLRPDPQSVQAGALLGVIGQTL
jgi:hypothetical protein